MSESFASLDEVANKLRKALKSKKHLLLFAHNSTGKTRLSMAFKEVGRNGEERDTLYFNAFTEDLFTWDNDLAHDTERVLQINSSSRFFSGLQGREMERSIRDRLKYHADFDFRIDYDNWMVSFSREVQKGSTPQTIYNIKISRSEENLFIWCFFLAVAELATEGDAAYAWVKYIYIDDPISSLDDNNAIALASSLAQLIKMQSNVKTIISSHHALFFNVMCNELGQADKYFLSKEEIKNTYTLKDTGDIPFFHHVAMLIELQQVDKSEEIYTYHFNMLRNVLEKTANFHGFKNFSSVIKKDKNDLDGIVHARIINILNHGNYPLFEPKEMSNENKQHFKYILRAFLKNYEFYLPK